MPDRPTASTLGALDFVQDVKYSLPIELICEKVQEKNKSTQIYRYLVDEANPWQPSARAHHAVDLIFLFGTMDISHNPTAADLGNGMRKRWIDFVNGDKPWAELSKGARFAFGPYGECKEIDQKQYAARRRVHVFRLLKEAGAGVYGPIVNKLIAGKISLLN